MLYSPPSLLIICCHPGTSFLQAASSVHTHCLLWKIQFAFQVRGQWQDNSMLSGSQQVFGCSHGRYVSGPETCQWCELDQSITFKKVSVTRIHSAAVPVDPGPTSDEPHMIDELLPSSLIQGKENPYCVRAEGINWQRWDLRSFQQWQTKQTQKEWGTYFNLIKLN